MQKALGLAQQAARNDEIPVGAVLVQNNKIITSSHNTSVEQSNPLLHAEINVLNHGFSILKSTTLSECDLYVTLEPCPMCAYAISIARIRNFILCSRKQKNWCCYKWSSNFCYIFMPSQT